MRFVKRFEGSERFDALGVKKPEDAAWKRACEEGDAALKMSEEERLSLVIKLLPSDDESEENTTPHARKKEVGDNPPKRRRIIMPEHSSDESGEEYKPVAMESSESEPEVDDSVLEGEDIDNEELDEDSSEEVDNSRKRKKKVAQKLVTSTPQHLKSFVCGSPATPRSTKQKLSEFSCRDEEGCEKPVGSASDRHFFHLSCDFLKPEKIRDANRKRPDDAEYDPRSLYIPEDFKRNLTPAMRQWWDLKAKHFDVILFFKLGKFYEIYHMDALIAVKELGIILMKGIFFQYYLIALS